MKILVSYDDMLSYTTGNYFLNAFKKIADTDYINPKWLDKVEKKYDFYIKIDDGLYYNKWREDLHPSAYYIIDSHMGEAGFWRKDIIKEGKFDFLFTAQRNGGEALGVDAKWVPLGCDPVKHIATNGAGKEYDVCFIGNFHSGLREPRLDLVERLFKEYPNFFYGNRFFNEMADKFGQTKVIFNHSLNHDINMRNFEACAAGSLQLTSLVKDNGFAEMFEDGVHLVTYRNADEMVDKVKYYLSHPDNREKIAKAGMKHVLENHTYLHRAKQILREIN